MGNTNHVVLIGRLTRDAELKYTSGGMAVCKFALAVNERRKQGEQWVDEANFFDIVLWGKSGESLNQYLVKGKQVAVTGKLRQERWEQEGQNRSKISVTALEVELLGGNRGEGDNTGGNQNEERPQRASQRPPASGATRTPPQTQRRPPVDAQGEGGYDGFPDDIPF